MPSLSMLKLRHSGHSSEEWQIFLSFYIDLWNYALKSIGLQLGFTTDPFFEALQKKEGERNSLVSKSFTFYYSYLCFPFVISRLHSLLLLLCGDLRFSHGKGHRYRPPREEWDTAHARAGGIYRQADGVCQERRCHSLGACTTEWERGKSKDADCNRLRAQKIQEICIFQIINKIRMNKG